MVKFYLVNNINKNEPAAVKSSLFTHVKAKSDGSQTAIIAYESIDDENVIEKTKEELQQILDQWIDEENLDPYFDEVSQQQIYQLKINLDRYVS